MYLTSYFTNQGVPATGKSPVLSGWTLDGTLVISGETMSEVAGGFYAYNFTGYDYTSDYVFMAEESSLPQTSRYVIASNEVDSQRNQGITKQILGLVQGNFVMTGQTYDGEGRLLSADITTYNDGGDANSETNPEFKYEVTASYDSNGNLIHYKVVQIDSTPPSSPAGFTISNQSDGFSP